MKLLRTFLALVVFGCGQLAAILHTLAALLLISSITPSNPMPSAEREPRG